MPTRTPPTHVHNAVFFLHSPELRLSVHLVSRQVSLHISDDMLCAGFSEGGRDACQVRPGRTGGKQGSGQEEGQRGGRVGGGGSVREGAGSGQEQGQGGGRVGGGAGLARGRVR